MKVTVEITGLSHHQLTPYRVFRMLHKLAWRIHGLDKTRDAHGVVLQTNSEIVRVKVNP